MAAFVINESSDDTFTLTAANPRHLQTGNFIVLNQTTELQAFTAAQYSGVKFWALDAANAQSLLNGGAFQGYLLTPANQYGLTNVTLPAGQWWIGATYDGVLQGSQSVMAFSEVSSVTLPGVSFIGNVPMAASGSPGAWNARGFSITGSPFGYIETEASGGKFMIMTEAQFQSFKAAYPNGFTGGSYSFVYATGGQSGGPATEIEAELQLPAGNYEVVWINDTGGWAGGAAQLKFFANNSSGSVGGTVPTSPTSPTGPAAPAGAQPTSGPDNLQASAVGSEIHGGLGDDTLTGGAGKDYLRGDEGNDSITGGDSFDDLNGNMGDDTVSGGLGDDWVVGGKDQDRLFGDDGDDIVYGNLGSDTASGGAGADVVRGGQDNDSISGGAGADWMSGDRGDDTISGGTGADVFHSFGDAGIDRIIDFSRAEGDRIQLDVGTTYSAAQVGADTVLSLGGGGQVILVGVSLSSLTGDWLFYL